MYCLQYSQKLPISLKECWNYFSCPANLQKLTPENMDFCITNDIGNSPIYAGQIITYKIRALWNIPLTWVTEITQAQKPDYFIDEQRFGPYKFWHHEHRFKAIPNGVEVNDRVYYLLPLGPLGRLIHTLKIKKDLDTIFTYREAKLEKLFGTYTR